MSLPHLDVIKLQDLDENSLGELAENACDDHRLDILTYCIQNGLKIENWGIKCFVSAVSMGNVQAMQLLIDHGVKPRDISGLMNYFNHGKYLYTEEVRFQMILLFIRHRGFTNIMFDAAFREKLFHYARLYDYPEIFDICPEDCTSIDILDYNQ